MKKPEITIDNRIPDRKDILSLYTDAGWTAYTDEPDALINGVNGSFRVYCAWSCDELVGMARIIGDGFTIVFIQDILVKRNFRRQGIGSSLVRMIMSDHRDVRQLVLLTDISGTTDSFYRSLGLSAAGDIGCRAYIKK